MRWELRQVAELTSEEQEALRTLSLAVYPPEISATWPGRAIEWAAHQWAVAGWDAEGAALCYAGVIFRDARWNEGGVLFFLDEATVLATGHRPCAECRHARFLDFCNAWGQTHPNSRTSGRPTAQEIDDLLHTD